MSRHYRRNARRTGIMVVIILLLLIAITACVIVIAMVVNSNKIGNSVDEVMLDEITQDIKNGNIDEIEGEEIILSSVDSFDASSASLYSRYGMSMEVAKNEYGISDERKDIAELKRTKNEDIYAWLSIPMANIDEPILQRVDDAVYYESHNEDGVESDSGALYTQSVNGKDFTDNMTVIYGNKTADDKLFSNLKLYKDPGYFEQYPYINIYTEKEILIYQVFAAYEYANRHIVLFHNTQDDTMFQIYIDQIEQNAGMNSNLNTDIWPTAADRLLTLSTPANNMDDTRFIVQAKLVSVVEY